MAYLGETFDICLDYKITKVCEWINSENVISSTCQPAIKVCSSDDNWQGYYGTTFYMKNNGKKAFYIRQALIKNSNAFERDPQYRKPRFTCPLENTLIERSSVNSLGFFAACNPSWWLDKNVTLELSIMQVMNPVNPLPPLTPPKKELPSANLQTKLAAMLDSGSGADFALESEGQSIPCHSFMLSAQSSVFKTMFEQDGYKENNEKKLRPDMSLAALKKFLKFIYTDELEIEKDINITIELFAAGHCYDVQKLFSECGNALVNNVNIENAARMYKLGHLRGHKALQKTAARLIKNNSAATHKTEAWNEIKQNPEILNSLILDICNLK